MVTGYYFQRPLLFFKISVPKTGFEPARRFQRYHLKVVRLPISPPGLGDCKFNQKTVVEKSLIFIYFLKAILKVVPLPGLDSRINNLPPWYSSTMRLASVSPTPQPRFLVLTPGLKISS